MPLAISIDISLTGLQMTIVNGGHAVGTSDPEGIAIPLMTGVGAATGVGSASAVSI